MKTTICPVCDFESAEEQLYASTVDHGAKETRIEGLKHFVCPQCSAEFVDDDQSRFNLSLSQAALGEEPRFVSPLEIRNWRNSLGLTQKECARLLGGGVNAFSKYEKGEIVPTDSMDNLLWLGMRYPGLIVDLAERKKVHLSDAIKQNCGYALQFTHTWFDTVNVMKDWQSSAMSSSFWERFLSPPGVEVREYTITAANDTELVFEDAA